MMPRQPSVPNFIEVVIWWWSSALVVGRWLEVVTSVTANDQGPFLHQFMQPFLVQVLHDFPHILRLRARGNEERIVRFYNYQIIYSDNSNKLIRGMNVISRRIQRERTFGRDQITVSRLALRDVVFVQGVPRSQIVPSEVCRQAEDVRLLLSL